MDRRIHRLAIESPAIKPLAIESPAIKPLAIESPAGEPPHEIAHQNKVRVMPFTIRRVTAADYDDVRRITREAYLHAGYFDAADHPYVQVLADVEHRAEHAEVWVGEDNGVVVGSFAITFEGQRYTDIAIAGELEFRMLAVDPAAQRGGYGRRMVEWIIDYARSIDGVEAVSLTSGTDMVRAHRLYESLGFERVPSRDWWVPGENIQLWVFRLALQPDSTVTGRA